jgi:carboxymethylenebutenolidase
MVIVQHPTGPNDEEPGAYGRMIDFGRRRDAGRGYLASSDRVGQGVLILHEWFGLQPFFVSLADRLREEGFTVLVPDIYEGAVAADVEEAERLMRAVDDDENRIGWMLKAAASYLIDNWHPRLGVIGFSMGAGWACRLAQEIELEATVLYYGTSDVEPARWRGAVQGHFAETDDFEPLEEARAFMVALEDGGVEVDAHVYPGTGHWFANRSVPDAYDEASAELALQRTVSFLRHHLA